MVKNARLNGVNKGLSEERMFVREIICGKAIGRKRLEIKGRSRMGIRKTPKCSIKMVIEEKSLKEYYKLILKG